MLSHDSSRLCNDLHGYSRHRKTQNDKKNMNASSFGREGEALMPSTQPLASPSGVAGYWLPTNWCDLCKAST